MRRASYRDRALVVRTYDFGEADRIVVLLTRRHGIVRGVAKGVRKAKSRFGSRIQPFVDLDVQLYDGRNLATITQADTVAYYASGIIDDYDRYTAASVALEAGEKLASVDDDPFVFDALVSTLALLQTTQFPLAVLDAYLLQIMEHAGWAPSLFDCASCGEPGPHHAFHPEVGGAACLNCRPSGSAEVPEQALHLMWLLANNHLPEAMDILCVPDGEYLRDTAHRLTIAHLQWHLETSLTSAKVMDQN